jgi:transcriptional regulator with XRE-family HTH domain
MTALERRFDVGTRNGQRVLLEFGSECRDARLTLGLSQAFVAERCRIARSTYSRIETGRLPALSFRVAARVAAVLGLRLSARVFPQGDLRDGAQARRLLPLLQHVSPALSYRTEVPLPARSEWREYRAWDVMLYGHGQRTGIEFESRLYDAQAQTRKIQLKQRDDPTEHFLLVVAATRANRRTLALYGDLFLDWPRLRTATVLATLRAGQHPPTGLILL